jgi:hypothetical protein
MIGREKAKKDFLNLIEGFVSITFGGGGGAFLDA